MGQLIDKEMLESGVRGNQYHLAQGQVLSPAALEYVQAKGIEIVRDGRSAGAMPQRTREIEALSERITRQLLQAGHQPGQALVDAVAAEVAAIEGGAVLPEKLSDGVSDKQLLTCLNCNAQKAEGGRQRVVVSAAGRNNWGIVAALSAAIAEARADILDISQTLVGDYFTMIMVLDIANAPTPFETIRQGLLSCGEKLGIHVAVMHDDILKSMHRV